MRDVKVFRAEDLEGLRRSITERVHEIVEDVMQDEVLKAVTDVMLERVQLDVYDAYSPRVYERREGNQGLADPSNIVSELKGKRTKRNTRELYVWNMAKKNPTNDSSKIFSSNKKNPKDRGLLQGLVITGWSNVRATDPAFRHPRPFIERTNEALRSEAGKKILEEALDKGLAKRGRDIERVN